MMMLRQGTEPQRASWFCLARELPQLPLYYDDRDMKRRDRDHVCKHGEKWTNLSHRINLGAGLLRGYVLLCCYPAATSSTVPFHVGGRRWNDASALAQSRAHKLGSKNVGDRYVT